MQGIFNSGFEVLPTDDLRSGVQDDAVSVGSDEEDFIAREAGQFELVVAIGDKEYYVSPVSPDDDEVRKWAELAGSTVSFQDVKLRRGRIVGFSGKVIAHLIPSEGKGKPLPFKKP